MTMRTSCNGMMSFPSFLSADASKSKVSDAPALVFDLSFGFALLDLFRAEDLGLCIASLTIEEATTACLRMEEREPRLHTMGLSPMRS